MRPLLLALLAAGCSAPAGPPQLTVYCAQDREFAEGLFPQFTSRTNVAVAAKYDTEANKSVSLVEELLRERGRPRCGVHWNNEVLGTIRLQRAGVLEPYDSPAAEGFPDWARPADRTWTAFASRARVILVNTELVPEADRPRSVFDLAKPAFRGRVAIAKPLFGTTATHAACLFEAVGPEAAKGFFRDLRANGVHVVAGNKPAAEGVGLGRFAACLTDTDDAAAELRAGRPVAVVFPDAGGHPDHPRLGTLFIPNTLAVVRGGPAPEASRLLVDFLLSQEVEAALSRGNSHQYPVNPTVPPEAPAALRPPAGGKRMAVDFAACADRWEEAYRFLKAEFAAD